MKDRDEKDSIGRYAKGLSRGRPPGAKNKSPRVVALAARANADSIRDVAKKHLPEVLEALAVEAKTNHVAAANFIRLVAPVAPKAFIEGAEAIAGLALEDRLSALTALMARGVVDLASGTALAGVIKAEIEYVWLRPMKKSMLDMERAMKSGDRKAAEEALFRLARELSAAAPAIDAEVVE